jgi:hypothetical protein
MGKGRGGYNGGSTVVTPTGMSGYLNKRMRQHLEEQQEEREREAKKWGISDEVRIIPAREIRMKKRKRFVGTAGVTPPPPPKKKKKIWKPTSEAGRRIAASSMTKKQRREAKSKNLGS